MTTALTKLAGIVRADDLPQLHPNYSWGPVQAFLTIVNNIAGAVFVLAILALVLSIAAILFKGFGSQWGRDHAGKGFLISLGAVILFGGVMSILTWGMGIDLGL